MSKFRALLVSVLLTTSLAGGALAASTTAEAGKVPTKSKAPIVVKNGGGSLWCC